MCKLKKSLFRSAANFYSTRIIVSFKKCLKKAKDIPNSIKHLSNS